MDLFKNNIVAGVGVALAAAILAPIVLPVAGRLGRPLAKSLVRGGMVLYEKGRETMAVAGESVEDIMAEIRAENKKARAAPASAAPERAGQAEPEFAHADQAGAGAARHDGQGGTMQ